MKNNVDIKISNGSKTLGIIAIVIILFLSGGFYYYFNKSEKAKIEIENLSGNIEALTQTIGTYEIRLNDSTKVHVSKVRQLGLEISDWKQLYKDEVEVVSKLKSRTSDVTAVTTVSTVTTGSAVVPVHFDSIHQLTATYNSKYMDITATILSNGTQAKFNYEHRDSLLIVETVERKTALWGLIRWGNRRTYLEAVSFNPKSKILGISYKKIIL